MKLNVTSADTSVASTHIVDLRQVIEAQVIRNSGWDYTSSSSYITLSFQIRSSKTGTYCVFLYTNDGSAKMYTAEYTVSSADTWEQKVIAIPGNSNLTFNNDNGNGVQIGWTWACGTDRDGTAETWSDLAFATSNQVNFLDSTSNVAYLTGVQLEVGQFTSSTLPAFQQESFGDNLARCQRYYLNYLEGTGKIVGMTASYTSSEVVLMHNFPTTMRSAPTMTIANATASHLRQAGTAPNTSAITLDVSSTLACMYNGTVSSGGSAGEGTVHFGDSTTNCTFSFESEL